MTATHNLTSSSETVQVENVRYIPLPILFWERLKIPWLPSCLEVSQPRRWVRINPYKHSSSQQLALAPPFSAKASHPPMVLPRFARTSSRHASNTGLSSSNLHVANKVRTHPFSDPWLLQKSCRYFSTWNSWISNRETTTRRSFQDPCELYDYATFTRHCKNRDKLRVDSYQVFFWQRWFKHYTCDFVCPCMAYITYIPCKCSYQRLWLGFGPQSPRAHSQSGLLPTNVKINNLGKQKKCALQKQMKNLENFAHWQNSREAWNMKIVWKYFTLKILLSKEIVVSDARRAVLSY